MNNNQIINIYYSADSRLFKQLVISLISLANTTTSQLNIINLSCEIPEYSDSKLLNNEQISLCNSILKKSNNKNIFRSLNVSDLVRKFLLVGPNVSNKFYKHGAFLSIRWLITKIPNYPKRMIWLDTDTIILKDIVELWNINNDYVEVYGRVDDYTWYEKYRHITKYLQTGVMLLNLELLNKNKTIDNTIKLIQTKKMYCTDMTAINKTCHSKKILSRKFNSYHWTKKAIIHHACGTWIHHGKRIQVKQDDERIFLKIHPQYKRIYDQLNKIVKMNKNLF